jgi:hypothetical protein
MQLKKSIIISLITFVLFTIEAMFHFSIGKNGHNDRVTIKMHKPSAGEFAQILAVVFVFSIINGSVLGYPPSKTEIKSEHSLWTSIVLP